PKVFLGEFELNYSYFLSDSFGRDEGVFPILCPRPAVSFTPHTQVPWALRGTASIRHAFMPSIFNRCFALVRFLFDCTQNTHIIKLYKHSIFVNFFKKPKA